VLPWASSSSSSSSSALMPPLTRRLQELRSKFNHIDSSVCNHIKIVVRVYLFLYTIKRTPFEIQFSLSERD
jgi:hypothetical protein